MNFKALNSFFSPKLQDEIPRDLYYHNYSHIMDVMDAAERIAGQEGVDDDELVLLKTAVLFHDSGFISGTSDHELVSCELAREYLPKFQYSVEQIERICGMIQATKLPQNPQNHLEQIICDADLDYLGRSDFWEIGGKLFKELKGLGLIGNETIWNQRQVSFLEMHQYFTNTAKSMRKAKKEANLEEVKARLLA